jgi:hypothetical protein
MSYPIRILVLGVMFSHGAISESPRLAGGTPGLVRVLADEKVQSALSISAEQIKVAREADNLLRRIHDGKAQRMARTSIQKSLNDDQFKRLERIHWQRLGARAVFERRVRADLKISRDQVQALQKARAVNDAEYGKMKDFLSRARFGSQQAMEMHKQRYYDAADKRLLDVLTKTQRKKLKTLTSAPTKAPLP